jgi:hypothetical protein
MWNGGKISQRLHRRTWDSELKNGLSVRSRVRRVNIKKSLDAVAINVTRKKRNKVEEDNVEPPTQTQTGDEEAAV